MKIFTNVMKAGFVALALLGSGLVWAQAATDVNCDGCVHSGDIATNGVRRADIQPYAINTPKLNNYAVSTAKIKPGAVTGDKIAEGAVTVNKVAPELSNAIGMFCPPDETVVGMETDGTLACEMPQTLAGDINRNTRAGTKALSVNTGSQNTAFGHWALFSNTFGDGNTAVGEFAIANSTTGNRNTAVGGTALGNNTTGSSNTAVGFHALLDNRDGDRNTACGRTALGSNITGSENTAVGNNALQANTGNGNVAIGYLAGQLLTTGSNNIAIGNKSFAAESSTTRIGSSVHLRTFIAGIRGTTTGINDASTVVIDGDGQLGTISSSRRYKEEIHDMEAASEPLLNLRPVTFRYKKAFEDGDKPVQFGLIAEEVADVFPELVVYNEDGAPEAVKYRLLSTLLLNELQNQRAELQEMQTRLMRLENAKSGAVASNE